MRFQKVLQVFPMSDKWKRTTLRARTTEKDGSLGKRA